MIHLKQLGQQDYLTSYEAMQAFTQNRTPDTDDEIWLVEHPPVFTQGLNGQAEHLLALAPSIPLVQTDRGGQVTYHGPGQCVIYLLLDLKRARLGVRELVHKIEQAIIDYLATLGIASQARADAPGVYVNGQKIASLGLKIRKQTSYHGLALNVDMDLTPFNQIQPCGLKGMQMTQISQLTQPSPSLKAVQLGLVKQLSQQLQHPISSPEVFKSAQP